MAYIQDTTIALHDELAAVQGRSGQGPTFPTLANLRDMLTALIEASPNLGSVYIRAVDPDATTVTLVGEFHDGSKADNT